jgi:hypothetical protein
MLARVMCFTVSAHISFTFFGGMYINIKHKSARVLEDGRKQVSAILGLRNAHKICASQGAGRQPGPHCEPGERVLPLTQVGLAVRNINASSKQINNA